MSFAITFGGDIASTDAGTQAAISDGIVTDLVIRSETRMVAITAGTVLVRHCFVLFWTIARGFSSLYPLLPVIFTTPHAFV